MTALNEAPLSRLGKRPHGTFRSPLEVFTGLKPARTQMLHGRGMDEAGRMMSLERTRAIQLMKIESLQTSFDNMHKEVNEKVTANRKKQIAHHNRKTNIITPDFSVGDFVLIRRAQDKGPKQSF